MLLKSQNSIKFKKNYQQNKKTYSCLESMLRSEINDDENKQNLNYFVGKNVKNNETKKDSGRIGKK